MKIFISKLFLAILFFWASLFSCKSENPKYIKSYDIEFDGGKNKFYNKYNLWLTVSEANQVIELKNLIQKTTEKVNCINTKPVMWEIDVYANYENKVSGHELTLGSSTYNKESLSIGKNGCFRNVELINKLKELMIVDSIKKYNGKMRQAEFDKMLTESKIE